MKLFTLPDGTVNRLERAQWLTIPFDLAFSVGALVTGPLCFEAVEVRSPWIEEADATSSWVEDAQVRVPWVEEAQVGCP